ncbi:MAG: hypothetical protein HPAVJP_1080 [Candidatus Hepatoplasma vulgare]|nr:MAG: hypothetical protein HPAVJP_1080 [Candidatus Hepatoplasma sp.]
MNNIIWKKTFSVFFITVFSISALSSLIFWSLSSKTEILFHFGNKETIKLDKNEINNLEDYVSLKNSDLDSDINYYSLPNFKKYEDDTSDDSGDDTTTPEIVFGNQTVNEMTADWMTVGFMNYALTGDTHYPDGSFNPDDDYPDYGSTILNPSSEDTWITPHLFDTENTLQTLDYQTFYDYSSYVKLFTETIGKNAKEDYLALYLNAFATKYDEISKQIWLDQPSPALEFSIWTNYYIRDNYPEYIDDFGNPIFETETMNLISTTIEYEKDISNFMYIYSYLWQEYSDKKYDYFITSMMNQNRFTYYWSMQINDKDGFLISSNFDPTDGADVDEWNSTGFNITEGTSKTQIEPTWRLSPEGYMGFSGLSSQSDSSISLLIGEDDYSDDFWNYSNVWSITENLNDEIDNYSTSYISSYNQEDFVSNGLFYDNNNYIFSSTTSSDSEDTTTTTDYIYMKYLLYPFVFTNNIQPDGTSSYWVYRLDAYTDGNGQFYPTAEVAPSGANKINYFDYIDQVLQDTYDNYNYYGLFEILTIYQMLNYTTENFNVWENKAYNYWNSKGFYIELHGQAKDDYGSLIPDGLQRD